MKRVPVWVVLAWVAIAAPIVTRADGTLSINVAAFQSEVKLKDKVRKQIEGGGMEWGLAGNRLAHTP